MKTLLAMLSGCEIMEHLEMSGMGCLLQNGGNRSGRREEGMVVEEEGDGGDGDGGEEGDGDGGEGEGEGEDTKEEEEEMDDSVGNSSNNSVSHHKRKTCVEEHWWLHSSFIRFDSHSCAGTTQFLWLTFVRGCFIFLFYSH